MKLTDNSQSMKKEILAKKSTLSVFTGINAPVLSDKEQQKIKGGDDLIIIEDFIVG